MNSKNISNLIEPYLWRYAPSPMRDDVRQDIWLKVTEQFTPEPNGEYVKRADKKTPLTEDQLWSYAQHAVRDYRKENRPHADVYEVDPPAKERAQLDFIDLDLLPSYLSFAPDERLLLTSVICMGYEWEQVREIGFSSNLTEESYNECYQVIRNHYPNTFLTTYTTIQPETSVLGNSSKKVKKSQKSYLALHVDYTHPDTLAVTKHITEGHIRYAVAMLLMPQRKEKHIRRACELLANGMTSIEVLQTMRRRNQEPPLTLTDIRALRGVLHRVSAEQAAHWEPEESAKRAAKSTTMAQECANIKSLEELEAVLMERGIRCHIVHESRKYLLLHAKAKCCDKTKKIAVYENEGGAFTFCCFNCAAKNRNVYRLAGGNNLRGALRLVGVVIETEADYTLA